MSNWDWKFDNIKVLNTKYPNINYGGCGVFSYHLYKILLYKYNITSKIFYINSTTPPGLKKDYDIWFSHIYINLLDIYIDNNGFYKDIDRVYPVSELSIDKLSEMVSIPELWNNKFDHSTSNLLVNEMSILL